MNTRSLSTRIAQMGGADPDLLDRAPSEKARFVNIGVVVLTTAALSTFSMFFALVDGLAAPWWVAGPLGFGWGFTILNLTRLLIVGVGRRSGPWRTAVMLVPRLAILVLIAIVIVTPLVLRIFQTEIADEVRATNLAAVAALRESPDAKRLDEFNEKIATDQQILAGNIPGVTSAKAEAAQARLREAQTNLEQKRTAAANLYDAMRCELTGEMCSGSSGKVGSGPRYESLKRQYERAEDEVKAAEQSVALAQKALDDANEEARLGNPAAVQEAQTAAQAELPGLVAEREQLQAGIDAAKADVISNTGLLAQLQALDRIGARNPRARLAHLLVGGLLVMLELLPLMIAALSAAGPTTSYDRAVIRRDLEDVLLGPKPTNYDGWMSVEPATGAEMHDRDGDRTVLVTSPSGDFDLVVTIGQVAVAAATAERLSITDGVSQERVEFVVELDSDEPSLRHPGIPVVVDARRGSASARFALQPAADRMDEPPWLWIRATHGRRTMQSIELSVTWSAEASVT